MLLNMRHYKKAPSGAFFAFKIQLKGFTSRIGKSIMGVGKIPKEAQ